MTAPETSAADTRKKCARDVAHNEPSAADAPERLVPNAIATTFLPFVLSLVAGSVDVIGFLGLGGLFIAHITGNLVTVAARLAGGDQAPVAHLISVPVFIVALALVRLLAVGLERIGTASLLPLLVLQFVLLGVLLAICLAAGPSVDPNAASMVVAGMLGVSAMAVQNALVQISLNGAPSTAVMTTNMTRFVMDLGEVLFGRDTNDRAKAGERARRIGLVIAGFFLGCILGAACEATLGLRSFALPTGLALIALALGASAFVSPANALSFRRN